jgi:ribosome biogenesis GTPase
MNLEDLGWSAHFQGQVTEEEWPETAPARVIRVRRGELWLQGDDFEHVVPPGTDSRDIDVDRPALGDWFLLDPETHQPIRRLERKSILKRKAPGTGRAVQLIVANVDVLFIVSSCNDDFNLARLERYIALAFDAGTTPVLVLTKADLCENPEDYAAEAAQLGQDLAIECIDARDPVSSAPLKAWCGPGQTVALLGSSGVGKSRLTNTLRGTDEQKTAAIREVDSKGRHTTTERVLLPLEGGGWIADTPGLRELQLYDAAEGISAAFADIEALAAECHFRDCSHDVEPRCAVTAAVKAGTLPARRVENYRKLRAEEALARETIGQRRGREKVFSKMVRDIDKDLPKRG